MNYIDIEKDEIPYSFEIDLGEEEFTIEMHYNGRFDFFTVDLYKNDKPLVYGEKLILDRPLFDGLVNIELPKVTIIPKDRSSMEKRITYANLNETVYLYVFDPE
ncbi:phage baseplate plug protein [Sporosarcina contaminans]|uniref:Phage baseplate plug protein n=1 Tax=Sporosarcina contaminans TaxID=633403 RepID=A0ABW3U1M7_9BACL